MEFIIILLTIFIDQITKYFSYNYLKAIQSFDIVKGLLSFTYVENTGVAFGMFKNVYFVLVPLTVLITVVCLYYMLKAKKHNCKLLSISLSLIVSGAVGNLIDRIIRGFVVDFIEVTFIEFPVFNFADICVVCGAILTVILVCFTKEGDIFDNKK